MPRRRPIVPLVVSATVMALLFGTPPARAAEFEFHHENVMGTSLELRVHADDSAAALRGERRVLGEIDRLSAILSGYDPRSEFSRWQARPAGALPVSRELYAMLESADRWNGSTRGAFDPRVEVLSRLWSTAADQGRLPTSEEIARARATMAAPAWKLDPKNQSATRIGDCPISLNAIAKGFIVGRACEVALEPNEGVRGLSLNVGGDLRVLGDFVQGVGIASPFSDSESSEPFTRIEVRDRAVATSGSSQRGLWIGGKWYSHIFDPRSGEPADRVASVTVIAERSADADALATCFNVLGPGESLRIAESLSGVECLIVAADGAIFRSKGWSRLEKPGDRPVPVTLALAPQSKEATQEKAKDPTSAHWGDANELVVDFEIRQPDPGEGQQNPPLNGDSPRKGRGRSPKGARGRYRRPYVAVWVENQDGFPVRTLVLWVSQTGAGPFQWIPDLKRWHASDKVRKKVEKKDIVLTIARPTRPPGKYSAVWNGKDDKGKPLPPGKYTISIDAAREHGTYQNLRKEVTVGDKPFSEELEGGIEIGSARITYRAKKAE